MYARSYENMHLTALSKEQRTFGYLYAVTCGIYAHTAFSKKENVLRWLEERGLKIEKMPEPYTRDSVEQNNWVPIHGKYIEVSHMDEEFFNSLPNVIIVTKDLSNGDYVEAKITEEDGIRVVHTLNPNVKTRKVFDYFETSEIFK